MTATTDWLDAAQARADAATPGPWEMQGDSVYTAFIPATSTAARRDPQRLAEVWTTDEDTIAIAAARTDLPAALAALRAVLDLHCGPVFDMCEHDAQAWPCPTVTAIASALGVAP